MEVKRKEPGCFCARQQAVKPRCRRKKEQSKRKRQTFVFNVDPEEEVWHEPYMQCLRKEFSDVSIFCDSKIELPWKDLALPVAGMRIRTDANSGLIETVLAEGDLPGEEAADQETAKKESDGAMILPWHDLIVSSKVASRQDDPESCDSSVEIPWGDLTWEKSMELEAPVEDVEEGCQPDDLEIPWDEIQVPSNIVIETGKKRRHPSSSKPLRMLGDIMCCANCQTMSCGTRTTSTKSGRRDPFVRG